MTTISFVIPVRHPENARDWGLLKTLLGQTIRSIANQTHSDWRGVIVANRGADLPDLPEQFQVEWVDFPPNDLHELKGQDKSVFYDAFRFDKGRRVLKGMLALRDSDYFMIVDDDDFVSSRIAEFVAKQPPSDGWVVEKGWLWSTGGRVVMADDDFNHKCGTCLIVRADRYDLPERFEEADAEWIKKMLGSHFSVVNHFESQGIHLKPIPFRAAVYRVANPGSHSQTEGVVQRYLLKRKFLKRPHLFVENLMKFRPLTGPLRQEFFGAGGTGDRFA